MHQALYRKWRPSTFDEVYGQGHITSVLKYEVANGKASHAYLFCGSRGTGKTTCAKILAKAVNCLDIQNGNPCGKCEACRAVDAGIATDVVEMDAASNNGVDCIRDIREEVVYSPAMLKNRVYIVDEVHMLSASAFNALLKTLEEPPQNVVFILATTELHKIPATIMSRCQRFDFKRIASDVIADRLRYVADRENIDITDDAAYLIARLSQGGMRDALSLLELCSGFGGKIDEKAVLECSGAGGRETVFNTVKAVINCDFEKIFEILNGLYSSSKDISVFWQELMAYYRDMMVAKSCKNASEYLELTASEAAELAEASGLFSYEVLLSHCKMMDTALSDMHRNSGNARLIAEFALLRMCDYRLDTSPESLLARVKNLESGGATAPAIISSPSEIPSPPKEEPKKKEAVAEKAEEKQMPAQNEEQGAGKTVIRPFAEWIEVISRIAAKDKGLSAIMQGARAFCDTNGRIRIKVADFFSKSMMESEKNRVEIAAAVSGVTGKSYTADNIIFEIEKKANADGYESIDEIIARKEEI